VTPRAGRTSAEQPLNTPRGTGSSLDAGVAEGASRPAESLKPPEGNRGGCSPPASHDARIQDVVIRYIQATCRIIATLNCVPAAQTRAGCRRSTVRRRTTMTFA